MEWFLIVLVISFGDPIIKETLGPYYSLSRCEIAAWVFKKYSLKGPETEVKAYCVRKEN